MTISRLHKFLAAGTLALIAIMPFHAFIVVYLGKLVGHQVLFQAWKEALILLMSAASILLLIKQPQLLKKLMTPVNLLVIGFILVALAVSLIARPEPKAFLFGFKTDLAFLIVFLIAQLASTPKLNQLAITIILWTTGLVCSFGFLQVVALPADFLARFGYGSGTIQPFEMVDPAIKAVRILSTLGGPNQLGSFLILPICLTLASIIKQHRLKLIPLLGIALFVLWHTFSRSAWLGALSGAAITGLSLLPRKIAFALAAAGLIIVILAGLFLNQAVQQGSKLQYYLLHGRLNLGKVYGSDQFRTQSLANGIQAITQAPFGKGLGAAGPASKHSRNYNVTENYYLQLGIEVGLLGLMIFLALSVVLGWQLAKSPYLPLAPPLLGALLGISIINLFLHGWADSSTALIYWATAGIAFGAQKNRYVPSN